MDFEHHEEHPPEPSPPSEGAPPTESAPVSDPAGAGSPPPSPPHPRGAGLGAIALSIVIALAIFAAGTAWGEKATRGFTSLLNSLSASKEEGETEEVGHGFYTCGMHPWVILPKPGTCPICHMDLTPLDPSKFTGEVSIDPRVVQNIGVRIEEVKTGPLTRSIRTVGTVDYDETRVRDVNIKVKGWIESIHVDYLGAEVEAGEPLFDLYSPELYDTQEQYLLAFRGRDAPEVPFVSGSERDPERLLESSRMRLEFFDITGDQITELEKRGRPSKTLTINSPWSGVVISKHANQGMLVDPGMLVYRIADLSTIWVQVTLYEYQVPYITEGQKAVMSLPYIPGQEFEGKVIYIYPYLDMKTRELQVRLEFDNPSLLLKPGMFARVRLESTLARNRTLVPRSAIIDTGERQVAFVSLGEGKFEPRELSLGVQADGDRWEVIEGLTPGEQIVTSGQFLIDSEAKIREALAKLVTGNPASEQKAAVEVSGASELQNLPPDLEAALKKALAAYLVAGDLLAADKVAGLAPAARDVDAALASAVATAIPGHEHFWHQHEEAGRAREAATQLAAATDLEAAREKYADLSTEIATLVKATGVPPSLGKDVLELHCPMYRKSRGGTVWLQASSEVRNPFYGQAMLTCSDRKAALPVTGAAAAETSAAESQAKPAADSTRGRESPAPVPSDTSSGQDSTEPSAPSGGESPAAPAAKIDTAAAGALLPAAGQEALARLLDAYFRIGERLASDEVSEISPAATAIVKEVKGLLSIAVPGAPRFWREHPEIAVVRSSALALVAARSLEDARQAYADTSVALARLIAATGVPSGTSGGVEELHCPMYRDGQGGSSWLQPAGKVRNPYFGTSMLRCHDRRRTLPVSSAAADSPSTTPSPGEGERAPEHHRHAPGGEN